MADEISKTPEQAEVTNNTETDKAPVDVRETEAFKAVVQQLNAERAKLQAIEADRAKREQEEKERKAKEAGDFESIKKDYENKLTQFALETKRAKTEALAAEVKEKWAREGIINHLLKLEDGADPSEFIAKLKTESPGLFQADAFQASTSAQVAGRVTNGSDGSNWASVKTAFEGKGSPQQVADAINKVEQYRNANAGKMPPGF